MDWLENGLTSGGDEAEDNPYDFEISFSSKTSSKRKKRSKRTTSRSASRSKSLGRRKSSSSSVHAEALTNSMNLSALDKAKHLLQKYTISEKGSHFDIKSDSELDSDSDSTTTASSLSKHEDGGSPIEKSYSEKAELVKMKNLIATTTEDRQDKAWQRGDTTTGNTVADALEAWTASSQEQSIISEVEDDQKEDSIVEEDEAFQRALAKAEEEEEERRREAMASIMSSGFVGKASGASSVADERKDVPRKDGRLAETIYREGSMSEVSVSVDGTIVSPLQSVVSEDAEHEGAASQAVSEAGQLSSIDAYSSDAFDAESEDDRRSDASRSELAESAHSRIQRVAISSGKAFETSRVIAPSWSKADASTQCYDLKDSSVQANLVVSHSGLVYEIPHDGCVITNPFLQPPSVAAPPPPCRATLFGQQFIGFQSPSKPLPLQEQSSFGIPKEVEQITSVQTSLAAANAIFLRNLELIRTQLSSGEIRTLNLELIATESYLNVFYLSV